MHKAHVKKKRKEKNPKKTVKIKTRENDIDEKDKNVKTRESASSVKF